MLRFKSSANRPACGGWCWYPLLPALARRLRASRCARIPLRRLPRTFKFYLFSRNRAAGASRFDCRQVSANVHGFSLACRKALTNRRVNSFSFQSVRRGASIDMVLATRLRSNRNEASEDRVGKRPRSPFDAGADQEYTRSRARLPVRFEGKGSGNSRQRLRFSRRRAAFGKAPLPAGPGGIPGAMRKRRRKGHHCAHTRRVRVVASSCLILDLGGS